MSKQMDVNAIINSILNIYSSDTESNINVGVLMPCALIFVALLRLYELLMCCMLIIFCVLKELNGCYVAID